MSVRNRDVLVVFYRLGPFRGEHRWLGGGHDSENDPSGDGPHAEDDGSDVLPLFIQEPVGTIRQPMELAVAIADRLWREPERAAVSVLGLLRQVRGVVQHHQRDKSRDCRAQLRVVGHWRPRPPTGGGARLPTALRWPVSVKSYDAKCMCGLPPSMFQ